MSFLRKFKVAFEGIFILLKKDRNFQVHLILFLLLLIASFLIGLSKFEWIAILVCSAMVFATEAVNSSIEKLADLITKEIRPEIKIIKDIAAAAVLITSIFSIVVALLIFIPKIWSMIY
jgi:diacylglycerol kinase